MSRPKHWLIVALVPMLTILLVGREGGGALPDPQSEPRPGRSTLRGKVTIAGERPNIEKLNASFRELVARHKDGEHCLKGNKDAVSQQSWIIDEKGGVANVVVWLRPPDGQRFHLDAGDLDPRTRTWPAEVVLDT